MMCLRGPKGVIPRQKFRHDGLSCCCVNLTAKSHCEVTLPTESFLIRPYEPKDRGSVRRISTATAMMGEPASRFFDGDDVLADLLTSYHTDFEPESCFVAEVESKVVGYIIGSVNERKIEQVFFSKVLGPAMLKAIRQGIFLRAKNWALFFQAVRTAITGGFIMPNFIPSYPASLHINVLDGYRTLGMGGSLIRRYLKYLSERNISGVHMATMSEKAGLFFAKYGFALLHRGRRSYFRHVIGNDVPLLVYGRKLNQGGAFA